MNKRTISIFAGLAFLIAALFIGTPFEFLSPTTDSIVSFVIIFFILLLFVLLFRQILLFTHKVLKRTTLILLIALFIPYLLIGVMTLMLVITSNPPMWQDTSIYTNSKGDKVIRQWRRTGGSIYDFRDRKIIKDFTTFRISYDCTFKNLGGDWTEYDIEKNTTKNVNLDLVNNGL